MPPQAKGPNKSRAPGSKVVPAIPHVLVASTKAKRDSTAAPAAPSVAPPVPPGADAAQLAPSSEAAPHTEPYAGPDHQLQAATNGDVNASASTSEQSTASTSQSTPPAPAPQSVGNGVQSSSKEAPTSGLDVHSESKTVPNALPPPFYPASQQSNPSPATSISAHPERPDGLAAMQSRNNSSLVFGGHGDSASPSPGPSMIPGTTYGGPPPLGPPFPNHNPGSAAFVPNGHAHRISEPFAGPLYPHPYMHNNGNGGFGRDYHPGPFVQGRPFVPNGRGPLGRRDYAPSPGLPPPRPLPGPVTKGAPDGLQPSELSLPEALGLARYLRSQFGNREHADHVVVISHSGHKLSPGTIALHGVMLARSPKLASLMSMSQSGPATSPRALHVVISDRFIDLDEVVTKGLLHLYGEPLLELEAIPGMLAASGIPPSAYMQLRAALAYAAVGHFLQMDAIIIRGLDLASKLLQWQNIGLALAFALEGGVASGWSEGPEERGSVSSSVEETSSPASAPVYGIYSERMLHTVTAFIIGNFPGDFELAAGVAQLSEAPRLPVGGEPRHARSGSRLSQIRFGEMTVEERGPEYSMLSAVLLSLPFAILKHVLEQASLVARLGRVRLGEVMGQTIEERERRRRRIAAQGGATQAGPESAVEERLWSSVRWAERVEGDGSGGVQLSRRCLTSLHEADRRAEGTADVEAEGSTKASIFA